MNNQETKGNTSQTGKNRHYRARSWSTETKKRGPLIVVIILLIVCAAGGLYAKNYMDQKRVHEADACRMILKKLAEVPAKIRLPEKPKEPEIKAKLTYAEKCKLLKEKYGVDVPDKQPDFAQLRAEVNADIYAWLYLPDTNVDYPVVQHATDNSFYLDYNLDGSFGFPGCIYTENYNKKDFTDKNTVIYGHNMNDGSMLATLLYYQDRAFMDSHPYVFIYAPDDIFVYRIYSASFFDDSHQLVAHDISTDEAFMAYLRNIIETTDTRNNIDKTVELTPKSKIISLSTCTNDIPDQRYVIQGVLLEVE